jgi:hypothetical protein
VKSGNFRHACSDNASSVQWIIYAILAANRLLLPWGIAYQPKAPRHFAVCRTFGGAFGRTRT